MRKNSKDYRIVKVNGVEMFFYLPNIGACRPISSNVSDDIVRKSPRRRPVPVSYPCPFCTEAVADEVNFEKTPTREKILVTALLCTGYLRKEATIKAVMKKNSILRTNAWRREKRIINFPNIRRSSQFEAAQIRAAI
ncbi:TPA: hypothetical protein DDY55_04455 [Candidatus Falkowbacteria bacterium]|nr:hypothetical protein [Candidatus Falkowbacteria bacterium]HAY12178.1 hypothetical protein [Candidatus Falkowbacteria bacterium]HBI97339.1 hypothetical protein [Candidatus Falkowbacteria bacterium]HBT28082.1 hypothetical protein [Candidatus Falkowbacteria bacterium]HBY14546.1 hypothetical protein [Candidatus Falkowbacteria bacterium]